MGRENLQKQITDSAGNVLYTYVAHWNIVNRLEKRTRTIKIAQIVLTALSTGGFLSSVISGIGWLSWAGGATSAIALGLNLYTLNFKDMDAIKQHTDAANDLWDIREAYKSLLVDYEDLSDEDIRKKRDELTAAVSKVYKSYPGTDEKSFLQAQKEIGKYTFSDGEAEALLHSGNIVNE